MGLQNRLLASPRPYARCATPSSVEFVLEFEGIEKPQQFCHTSVVAQLSTEGLMSLNAHLVELSEKHRTLERKIEEAIASPASDDAEIRRLKSEKLR